MKIKYLLPIATIAFATSAVAPLLTSCGNGNNEDTPVEDPNKKEWKSGEAYEPMTPAEEKDYKGNEGFQQLTQDYYDAIAANHAIILDDEINHLSKNYSRSENPAGLGYTKIEIKYSKISDIKEFVETPDSNYTVKYFNVDLDYTFTGSVINFATTNASPVSFEFEDLKIEMRNFPMLVNTYSEPTPTNEANDDYIVFEYLIPLYEKEGAEWTIKMPKITKDDSNNVVIGDMKTYNWDEIFGDPISGFEKGMYDLFTHPIFFITSNYFKNAKWTPDGPEPV